MLTLISSVIVKFEGWGYSPVVEYLPNMPWIQSLAAPHTNTQKEFELMLLFHVLLIFSLVQTN